MTTTIDTLVALINQLNLVPTPLTSAQLIFSRPHVDIGANYNTRIKVTAKQGSGFYGDIHLTYTRTNLSTLGSNLIFTSTSQFSVANLVTLLNAETNANLTASDLLPARIPRMCIGEIRTVLLTANPRSIGWIGNLSLTLMYGIPSNVSDLHTLLNTTLPSNNYLTN